VVARIAVKYENNYDEEEILLVGGIVKEWRTNVVENFVNPFRDVTQNFPMYRHEIVLISYEE
jgi:hypothetical protein